MVENSCPLPLPPPHTTFPYVHVHPQVLYNNVFVFEPVSGWFPIVFEPVAGTQLSELGAAVFEPVACACCLWTSGRCPTAFEPVAGSPQSLNQWLMPCCLWTSGWCPAVVKPAAGAPLSLNQWLVPYCLWISGWCPAVFEPLAGGPLPLHTFSIHSVLAVSWMLRHQVFPSIDGIPSIEVQEGSLLRREKHKKPCMYAHSKLVLWVTDLWISIKTVFQNPMSDFVHLGWEWYRWYPK